MRKRLWQAAVAGSTVLAALLSVGTPASAAEAGQGTPAAVSAATAPVVGMQDSWVNSCAKGSTPDYHPAGSDPAVPAVDSPYWAALDVGTVRFSPPWDIADHPASSAADDAKLTVIQDCFGYWLGQLSAHHVSAEIAFKPDVEITSNGHVLIPTLSQYRAAMKAFLADYGQQVRIISPWGEPEFQPSKKPYYELANGRRFVVTRCPANAKDATCGPALAAQMWVTVHHLCPSCTVIAGDFGSSGKTDLKYLKVYRRYLRDIHGGHAVYRPTVWAIHPYTDVLHWEHEIKNHEALISPQNTLVASFARQLKADGYGGRTQIWLDEISSFSKSPSVYKGETYSRAVQADGARDLLTRLTEAGGVTVPGEPVVTRIYYMRFAGDTTDALVVKGVRKPVYRVFTSRRK